MLLTPTAKTNTSTTNTSKTNTGTTNTGFRRAVGRSFGKWLAIGLVVLVALGASAFVVRRIVQSFHPLATRTVDRTGPSLLQAITGMSDYRAASAQFTVPVDVEVDARWMPAAIRGERTVLLASGSVDAGVDLSGLGPNAIVVNEQTKSVIIRLPHATRRRPQLDLARTVVVEHKRGVLDRIGSAFGDAPNGESTAMKLALTKLDEAAKASTVVTVAETNTRAMMTSLARGFGYNSVTVIFNEPSPTDRGTSAR